VTDFVLVPGAGGSAWFWHRVVDELDRGGHQSVAVELPGPDPEQGLGRYRELIVQAGAELNAPMVLAAQSLGGFSAPLACDALQVERLVLVNAMIPAAGETAGAWWDDVGWREEVQSSAVRDGRPDPDVNDAETLFFHDLPPDIAGVMRSRPAVSEAAVVFSEPWPLDRWPDVPTSVLGGRDDRFFPLPLQQRVAHARLGLGVEPLPGGHLTALSQPRAVAEALVSAGRSD
jgi:pimeloyl-ACP methyl ester carboxylesterase